MPEEEVREEVQEQEEVAVVEDRAQVSQAKSSSSAHPYPLTDQSFYSPSQPTGSPSRSYPSTAHLPARASVSLVSPLRR